MSYENRLEKLRRRQHGNSGAILVLPVYDGIKSRFSEWLTLLWAKISKAAALGLNVAILT